VRCLKLKFMKV